VQRFIEADLNEKSEWKPEWKRYVIDYSSSSEQYYKMPYLWLQFFLHPENEIGNDGANVNEVIAQVMKSSFIGESRVTYLRSNFSWAIHNQEIVVAVGNYTGSSSDGIGVLVKLGLADPGALMADWQTVLQVNILALTLNGTYSVRYLKTKVGRTMETDWSQYEFINYDENWSSFDSDESHQLFFIEYNEKVTKKYSNSEEVSRIESRLAQTVWTTVQDSYSRSMIEVDKGDLLFLFKPDLSVDHWMEYVAFGYWDWITGMGGIFSLVSTLFFWLAYYLGRLCGSEGSVGILPEMSFTFANLEMIQGIQYSELNKQKEENGKRKKDGDDIISAT